MDFYEAKSAPLFNPFSVPLLFKLLIDLCNKKAINDLSYRIFACEMMQEMNLTLACVQHCPLTNNARF